MYSVLIYGFPLVLLLFEWGLRNIMAVDTSGFTGPTLAAAGLSFLVPLTKPKILNVQVPGASNAVVTSRADSQFVAVTWLMILAFLFVWSSSCYASIKLPGYKVYGVAGHLFIGAIAYIVSLFMTFLKERM